MLTPPADADDDLPPAGMPFADLLTWLAVKLGRRPTLEEVAAVRWLQARREKRRARRDERRRLDWEAAAARRRRDDDEPAETPLRSLLSGPEMTVFWATMAWLSVARVQAASARPYDEWWTRPETVLRLAETTEREAARLPKEAVFELSPRLEAEGVLAYAAWKLAHQPDRIAPVEAVGLASSLIAAINAVTPAAAATVASELAAAGGDGDRRRILARLRQVGQSVQTAWPGADKLAGGPPLSLVPDPEPEPEPVPPGDGGDEPPTGPRPPGGGGGGRK